MGREVRRNVNRDAAIEGLAESQQGAMANARDQSQGSASQDQGHAQACDGEGADLIEALVNLQ